jgi:membrane protease YdiL (CAAX protease family)
MELLKAYWKYSKSPFYSLLFTLPMLIGYETMIFTLNHSDVLGMRNGADIIFRQFFAIFHIYGFYFVGFLVLISLIIAYYFHTRQNIKEPFNFRFFIIMFLESLAYSLLMFLFVNKIGKYLLATGMVLGKRESFVLALGAGVYEEFIFRVVLISGFLFFLKDILKLGSIVSAIIAILAASVIFSLFHYLGHYGEIFEVRSFIIRFLAGLFLSLLYVSRGYGITAYTHTLYDLLVLILG